MKRRDFQKKSLTEVISSVCLPPAHVVCHDMHVGVNAGDDTYASQAKTTERSSSRVAGHAVHESRAREMFAHH